MVMRERWLAVWVLVVCAGVGAALFQRGPAARIVAANRADPLIGGLETTVSLHPGDPAALIALTDALLANGAPGLALAAIDRAPRSIQSLADVADAKARALIDTGEASRALKAEREALVACEMHSCNRGLATRALRREQWLSELCALEVEDVRGDPNRALLAYRRSTREVRLESSGAW